MGSIKRTHSINKRIVGFMHLFERVGSDPAILILTALREQTGGKFNCFAVFINNRAQFNVNVVEHVVDVINAFSQGPRFGKQDFFRFCKDMRPLAQAVEQAVAVFCQA